SRPPAATSTSAANRRFAVAGVAGVGVPVRVQGSRSSEHESSHAPHLEDLDEPDAPFTAPDLTSFYRVDEIGLEVVGHRWNPCGRCLPAVSPSRTTGVAGAWCKGALATPRHGRWHISRSDTGQRRSWCACAATCAPVRTGVVPRHYARRRGVGEELPPGGVWRTAHGDRP